MQEKLAKIREEAIRQIQEADVPEKLNEARVKFLGKKGELTAVLKGMKDVAPEERPKDVYKRQVLFCELYQHRTSGSASGLLCICLCKIIAEG